MAYQTLAELVEAGRQAIKAEREAADAWLRNQPQREAAAATAFVDYMKKAHDVLIDPGDTPVLAYELTGDSTGATRYYRIEIVLPGMASYVETQIAIDSNGLTRNSDWLPVAQDTRGPLHDDLTAALLWLTAGEPLTGEPQFTQAGVAVDVREFVEA